MTERSDAGKQGESEAERHLMAQGMQVLERNYFTRTGEIDLVMKDGDALVFVEVKKRLTGTFGDGEEAVTDGKRRRIFSAAMGYVQRNGAWDLNIRFDVVISDRNGIRHYKSAFVPEPGLTYY